MTDLDSRLPRLYRRAVSRRMVLLFTLLALVAFWGCVYGLAVWLNRVQW